MFNHGTEGGLYLVTLNNDSPISANAGDRRIAHRAIKVRMGDAKVGKAANLAKRRRDYMRTFGLENVNFFVLAFIPGGKLELDRAESKVLESLSLFRIRGATGRLNEWINGASESYIREVVLDALIRSGVEHVVVQEGGESMEHAQKVRGSKHTRHMMNGTRKPGEFGGVLASPPPVASAAHQTLELIDLLFTSELLPDQDFERLHHRAVSLHKHKLYCSNLVVKSSDFARGERGETNRNLCRRLEFIASGLRGRTSPISRDEIDKLIDNALRCFPLLDI